MDLKFQFTLPCGERLSVRVYPAAYNFISIHAPVWGATAVLKVFMSILDISIHAPVWGATSRVSQISFIDLISIHAPVWGATAL